MYDEYEDDHNSGLYEHTLDGDSAEDTDEASECELPSSRHLGEPVEIKEQMYQDKLAMFNRQLEELDALKHPEYLRRVKKLLLQYNERVKLNELYRLYLLDCVDRDHYLEKQAAIKEFEEKKADLKENLLSDFEDRRKMIETERHTMELTGDSAEVKPTVTRKLRRRPNEPLPVVEKRRKPTNGQLVLLLDDKDVENDLKSISRGKVPVRPTNVIANPNNGNGSGMHHVISSPSPTHNSGSGIGPFMESTIGGMNSYSYHQQHSSIPLSPYSSSPNNAQLIETKIEDGKLWYERRWFHRGQSIFVEGKDFSIFPATISAITNDVVCAKKLSDNGAKIKINVAQLSRGKISIKRRAN